MSPEDSFDHQTRSVRKQEIVNRVRTSTEEELADQILELEQKVRQLEKISITDSLTELLNRNGLDQNWKRIFDHLKRHPAEDAGVMVLIDLNDFKKANDVYGHEIGDAVLVEFAKVINELTRQEDSRGRKGGDEFEIHLDGASTEQAIMVLDRINQELMNRTKHLFNGTPVVSMSRGIIRIDTSKTIEENRKLADQAMYQDKEGRKNGVSSEEEMDLVHNLGLR